jgi:hypothetical protein
LSEQETNELLKEAEYKHHRRRLGFLKNLYRFDSIQESAEREGMSDAAGVAGLKLGMKADSKG